MSVDEVFTKQRVLPYPATEGWHTWFTCRSDVKNPLSRGTGTDKLRMSFATLGTLTKELSFSEPVEIHDGEGFYTGMNMEDEMELSLFMPATPATATPGLGNANLVPGDVFIPAPANDGSHTIDLVSGVGANLYGTVVPVPAPDGNGYWDCDYSTGIVTATATPGQAAYHLLNVSQEAFLLSPVPLGNPLGVFEVETYDVAWAHPNHKVRVKVTKNSVGAGEWAGWLMLFRRFVTRS